MAMPVIEPRLQKLLGPLEALCDGTVCYHAIGRQSKTAQRVLPWSNVKYVPAEKHEGLPGGLLGQDQTVVLAAPVNSGDGSETLSLAVITKGWSVMRGSI
jgi:hypothetical protein